MLDKVGKTNKANGDKESVKINRPTEVITRKVVLEGIRPIMFDRYAGDNDTKLEPDQKFYLEPETRAIGLPMGNFMSFLSAHNTNSAPKRLRDKRKYKDICNACLSYVEVSPLFWLFKRDDKPIIFGKFVNDHDAASGCTIEHGVGRLDKGIPNPNHRPALNLPWALEFSLKLHPNREIKEQELYNLIVEGGRAIGLGTFRGQYGKFKVARWD